MPKLPTAILAGVAGLAMAGTAFAASRAVHSLNIELPGDSVAHIIYFGEVSPQITLQPVKTEVPILTGLDWPLSSFDRLSAELNRQATLMFYQAAALANETAPVGMVPKLTSLNKLPTGATTYYESTTTTSDGACTRTIHTTSTGSNQPLKVSTSLSGNCATGQGHKGSAIETS
ncbi:MAG: hypothetical protein NVS3B5_14110 [Sphingomicrobium sp.]